MDITYEYFFTGCSVNLHEGHKTTAKDFYYVLYINHRDKYIKYFRSKEPMGQYVDWAVFNTKIRALIKSNTVRRAEFKH